MLTTNISNLIRQFPIKQFPVKQFPVKQFPKRNLITTTPKNMVSNQFPIKQFSVSQFPVRQFPVRQLHMTKPVNSWGQIALYDALVHSDIKYGDDSLYDILCVVFSIGGCIIGFVGGIGYNINEFITANTTDERKSIALWTPVGVLFSSGLGLVIGYGFGITSFIMIPGSIIAGVMLGVNYFMDDSEKENEIKGITENT